MLPITVRPFRFRIARDRVGSIAVVIGAVLLASILFTGACNEVLAAQSRQDCNRCCEGKGYDEFFLEDCKLKCFRNPSHCTDGRSSARPSPEPEAAPPSRPSRPQQPAQPPESGQGRPRAEFRWPQPLNLSPGSEWEAAAHILTLNGITPQHPNAAVALQAVEGILVEFIRSNPQGGSLPTTQLEEIIRRLR